MYQAESPIMLLWIHPALQLLATGLGAYVMYMGAKRFACVYFKSGACFLWKRHVNLGKVVLLLWAAGLVLGVASARIEWGVWGLTGSHYWMGLAMAPLILFGYATGLKLQKPKKNPPALALSHGMANALLFLMALYQVWSGLETVFGFLVPQG